MISKPTGGTSVSIRYGSPRPSTYRIAPIGRIRTLARASNIQGRLEERLNRRPFGMAPSLGKASPARAGLAQLVELHIVGSGSLLQNLCVNNLASGQSNPLKPLR